MTDDEIRSRLLYHIMKQYGTQEDGVSAWVLPVIEEGPVVPCKISGKVAGNVLVLRLQEVTDDTEG